MDLPAEQTLIARRNGHALHADALPRPPYTPGPRRTGPRATIAALALVALLAAALRAFRLDYQSLWYDEGVTAGMAARGPAEIVAAAAGDIHPPLYYLLLRLWTIPFGTSEAALRSLSLLFGVAAVVVVGVLGWRLFGRGAGLAAALVLALSPLAIYYSQEARMYMPVAALGAGSTLCYVLALEAAFRPPYRRRALDRWRLARALLPWGGYVALAAATIYTQYFGFGVLAVQGLHLAMVVLRTRRWGLALAWIAALAAVTLLYLPWTFTAWRQLTGWPGMASGRPLPSLAVDAAIALAQGLALPRDRLNPGAALLLLLALAGALPWHGGRHRGSRLPLPALLPLVWAVVPTLVVLVLATRRPMYDPKFLIVAAPGLALLVGRGALGAGEALARLVRPAAARDLVVGAGGGAALALVAVAVAGPLHSSYFDPAYARDDYRAIAARIRDQGSAEDAVILNAPGQIEIFSYYYRGPAPVFPEPSRPRMSRDELRAELATIAATHPRVWMVLWASQHSDRDGVIEGWFDQHAFKASDEWYGGVRLALYAAPGGAAGPQRPLEARFSNGARLVGYSLANPATVAGDVLQLTLHWQAEGPLARRYKVFTHLVDAQRNIYGQRDAEPGGGRRPTTEWVAGETFADNYGLPVLPGTPPGDYQIELGMYLPESGERPTITAADGTPLGDHLLIGPLSVARPATPPSPSLLTISHPLRLEVSDDLLLLGYDLHPLGRGVDDQSFRAGETALLTLYWQARARPGEYTMRVRLLDAAGRERLVVEAPPQGGNFPTSAWLPGDLVRDLRRLPLPADLPGGEYRLLLEVDRLEARTATPGARATVASDIELGALRLP